MPSISAEKAQHVQAEGTRIPLIVRKYCVLLFISGKLTIFFLLVQQAQTSCMPYPQTRQQTCHTADEKWCLKMAQTKHLHCNQ